jgi:hypothetical protein
MSSTPEPEAPNKPAQPPEDDAPGKGDILALGIGCLVFLIMFGAIVLVAISRE